MASNLCVTISEKFWSHVDKRGPDECWPWIRRDGIWSLEKKIQFHIENKYRHIAHIAYELTFGTLLPGELVRHTCNHPSCCNPKHLLKGSHSDNMQDMIRDNRSLKGERHPLAKLTSEQVVFIRNNCNINNYTQHYEYASKFNVTVRTIRAILYRQVWTHI